MFQLVKKYALLCYRAGDNMVNNFGIEMAGYLTFMVLLSLFPYLVLMVSALGFAGQGQAGREFIELVLQHLPADAVKTIEPRIVEIISGPPQGLLTFAILSALWTSSSAVESIRSMLNRAYRVGAPPAYLRRRLVSIGQVLLFTLVFLFIILLLVFLPIAINNFTRLTGIGLPIELRALVNRYFLVIGGLGMFGMVAGMYYLLPNLKQTWRNVIPGAIFVIVLWVAGAIGVSFYFSEVSSLTPVYGSLSGFIATLIYFYVMALIFIYGAEFNHELHLARGKPIEEREDSHGSGPDAGHPAKA